MLLDNLQETNNDLGGRADKNLALASLLSVGDGLESISEDGSASHCWLVFGLINTKSASQTGQSVQLRILVLHGTPVCLSPI